MQRLVVFLCSCAAFGAVLIAPSIADGAMFEQCPHVDKDTGCQFLITATGNGVQVAEDPSQGPYDGEDDTLVGLQNESASSISSMPLSAEEPVFAFDRGGLCDPFAEPRAPGCVVLAQNPAGEPNEDAGEPCPLEAKDCGFPTPAGEPAGITFATPVGIASNGDQLSGYEGPTSWFSDISSDTTGGVVNFSPALAPGQHTYFALREKLTGKSITVGTPTAISTTLAGAGHSGAAITVVQGTPVTDTATLAGDGAASATGIVSYAVYSDASCTQLVLGLGTDGFSGAVAAASAPETSLAPGVYYWQAHFGGDIHNEPATSACGSDVLAVLAPTTTVTTQSGGGVSGSSLTVPVGTPVTDRARIMGSLAAVASGTVTYALYKDSKCTIPLSVGRQTAVLNGAADPSAAVKPKAGTYYWKATYSGGGLDAPSVSSCAGEVLVVALKANLGLPASNVCLNRGELVLRPRAPRGVKLASVEIEINGKRVKRGKLSRKHATISVDGLPKGTFELALLARSSHGRLYEEIRGYRACAAVHRKKHVK
jgi:hypothetical protein